MPHAARKRQAGQSLVEFASVATMLFMIIFGVFEFGRAYYYYNTITSAAEEGARYGIIDQNTACVTQRALQGTVAIGLTAGNVTVTCPDGSCIFAKRISVAVNYTFTAVAPFIPSFPMNSVATMRINRTRDNGGVCI